MTRGTSTWRTRSLRSSARSCRPDSGVAAGLVSKAFRPIALRTPSSEAFEGSPGKPQVSACGIGDFDGLVQVAASARASVVRVPLVVPALQAVLHVHEADSG